MSFLSKIKSLLSKGEKKENVEKVAAISEKSEKEKSPLPFVSALCFSAGGARCILQDVFVEKIGKILEESETNFLDEFSLFCGTGVGGVIAMILALGKRSEDVTRFVYNGMSEAFAELKGGFFSKFTENRYSPDVKYNFFDKIFAEKTLKEVKGDFLCTAFDKIGMQNVVFTPQTFPYLKLKELAMATTAEPVYFPSHKISYDGKKYDFITSSHIADNPSLYAYSHLREKYQETNIKILHLSAWKNPMSLEGVKNQKDWQNEGVAGFNMLQKLYRNYSSESVEFAMRQFGCDYLNITNNYPTDGKAAFEIDVHSISATESLKNGAERIFSRYDIKKFLDL